MKLHLPSLLRRVLLASLACAVTVADAAILHSGVSMITYTDFGQNLGRYAVGETNALLNYIRMQEGGVLITYVNPEVNAAYKLPYGMIDFSSQNDGGYGVAIGYNFYATVEHNGVHNNTFTGNFIGAGNAIHYQTVEYNYGWKRPNDIKVFILTPSNDHKIGRQSKLITDVTGSTVYGSIDRDWSALQNDGPLGGQLLYRAGSGTMKLANPDGTRSDLAGGYQYITGGISSISNTGSFNATDGAISTNVHLRDYTLNGINSSYPLPFSGLSGDSGSPAWIWNENTGRFEYLSALQSGDDAHYTQLRSAPQWAVETMESFNVNIDLAAKEGEGARDAITEVHIGAVDIVGETVTDPEDGHSATLWRGKVLDGDQNELARFIGVHTGLNTWADLSDIKDGYTDNSGAARPWYSYSTEKFNPVSSQTNPNGLTYWDVFFTEDLVFTAGAAVTTIQADADVDLGLGYVRLSKGDMERARFNIQGDHLINSAGYVIDSGVDAYITLTNPADYMYEWRAVVETGATLHIEGTGDSNALLNLGGQGTTYLNRTDGYAAYNVLANNGAIVVISGINQIKHDFTFGFRGGWLDMNGLGMTWNNGNGAEAEGFTIHALDEQAKITNAKAGSTTTLTWTQGGAQTWLGSFVDTENGGALKFIYEGGDGAVLTLHSIHTNLHNAGSGIEVQSGTLALTGTNTVHGMGSVDGRSSRRYFSALDWHYADMTPPVTIGDGATFELGSHARLIGDVTVNAGGTFTMREGVQHRMEYIEGGQILEDTYAIRDFYGLTGNVRLDNATFKIEFNEGVTATNVYGGAISGSGTLTVNTGMGGGIQKLTGANTMAGARSVTAGGLVLGNAGAFDTNDNATGGDAWRIGEKGWLAVEGVEQTTGNILPHIHTESNGALALAQDTPEALDMSGHANLFIGAEAGKKVEYGEGGMDTLDAWHTTDTGRHQWLFGGGGGEIVVNWLLTGDNDLVLGNAYMNGTVTLTNIENNFTGNIIFTEGSNVVLSFTNLRALGGARVDLSYGRAMSGGSAIDAMLNGSTITPTASGILLVDDSRQVDIDLTGHTSLQLGANATGVTYTGDITVGRNQTYRLGGPGELIMQNGLAANGTNDLIVDGQGFSGGIVALNATSAITGAVTVMGHDAALSAETGITGGDITLALAGNDALPHASGIIVKDGGAVIIGAGTSQHVKALEIQAGGHVEMGLATTLYADNLQIAAGTALTASTPSLSAVQTGGGVISGAINVGTLVKTGDGVLSLATGHQLTVGTLDVQGGVLSLDAALSVSGTILLHSASTINFNERYLTASLDVAAGETASISAAVIGFRGTQTHLASGGTLDLTGVTTVNLQLPGQNSAQSFGGTLTLKNTTLENKTGTNNMTYEFAHLHVDDGDAVLAQGGWNTFWNIHSLTGEGSFTWNSASTHSTSNILTLDGEGDFSGTIHFNRNHSGGGDGRRFQAFTVIAHDYAVQNAVVKMTGTDSVNYGALAINTDVAHMKGLTTDDYGKNFNVIYAGAALETPQADAPASTRNATIHLDVDAGKSYTFRGGVSGDETHALSLIKTGAGTQTFADGNGPYSTTATFQDVTVLGGTLNLNTTQTTVTGDYAIGQGATLTVNGGITLTEGHTLYALGVDGQSVSANLGSALTLAGGSLGFSGKGFQSLTDGASLLHLGDTLSVAQGQTSLTVNFTDTSYLQEGKTYRLSDGDFSALGLTYTATGVDFLTATFTTAADGLYVTWQAADGSLIWAGTDAAHGWTDTAFGPKEYTSASELTFHFTDAAANKNVEVGGIGLNLTNQQIVISGTGYTFSGSGITLGLGRNLTFADGASATFIDLAIK